MKHLFFNSISLIVIAIILFTSCEKEENIEPTGTGKVQFSIEASLLKTSNDVNSLSSSVVGAILSVKDESGMRIIISEVFKIYKFGEAYISEPIALSNGNYSLSEFILIDMNGEAVYAAPIEGSERAILVNTPLPIDFVVDIDQVTKVVPEVLSVENSTPEDFGYTTFSFEQVPVIDFLVGVFNYSEATQNLELTNANLMVSSQGEILFDSPIDALTNKITVNGEKSEYKVTITKPGYVSYAYTFSADSLASHFDYPLIVVLEEGNQVIIQPGATEGKDAFVSSYYPDKNYGNHELLQSLSWTISGSEVDLRSYLSFDLSALPEGCQIIDAKLSLYEHHTSGVPSDGHSTLTGSNESYIKRVITSWDESTISWNNQPGYTDENYVIIPESSHPFEDYIDIDISQLVRDIFNNPTESFGIVISLVDENPYKALYFASSDYSDATKHPKLVITYE